MSWCVLGLLGAVFNDFQWSRLALFLGAGGRTHELMPLYALCSVSLCIQLHCIALLASVCLFVWWLFVVVLVVIVRGLLDAAWVCLLLRCSMLPCLASLSENLYDLG